MSLKTAFKHLLVLNLFFFSSPLLAQSPNQSSLTIDQIMQGEDFVGYLPSRVEWSADSRHIFFSWNPDNDTIRSTYRADISDGEISKLSFDEQRQLPDDGVYSHDKKWKAYDKSGDLFLQDMSDYSVRQITSTNSWERSPEFSGDGKYIIYQSDNNLFSWEIATGSVKQLTDFRSGQENNEKMSEQDQWLENDQLSNFDILKKRQMESETREYRGEQASPERPETIYMGRKRLAGLSISPDMNYVVYRLMTPADDKNTMVPDFVTQSGYTNELNARAKVGGEQNTFESHILNLQTDSTYEIATETLEGIYNKPEYLRDYASEDSTYSETYDKPKDVVAGMPVFSQDGKAVLNITSEDSKDRWIARLDLETGSLIQLDHQHDEAWIGGPQVGWFANGTLEWIDDDHIWFKSEQTGYAHIYRTNVESGKTDALTSGNFEVLEATLSDDKKKFYMTTNEVSPHEHHFYHMPAKGGKRTRITTRKGGHEVTVSPDEKMLAVRYSYSNQPWELYVMPNKEGGEMTRLTNSTTDEFNAYDWRDPEIIRFTARDGAEVPASLYEPATGKKNGAAVIFVHGAGYLQNVHSWWPSYYREYMFHNFLADNGYTVLAIDFRASAGYGRDWRTAIYRHMGGKDLDDQVDGAAYLVNEHGIDAGRIGIYGGSYGGFITLMAMFNAPETFASGAALRSVTDWAHYNHGYTSRILNTPAQDSIAYARSSPIYFAEGLEGQLLILHGMVDTNVHFQDVVRLSQRLIELKKENWEFAVFPVEGHGFVESSSWSDEYRRIYKLFRETLLE